MLRFYCINVLTIKSGYIKIKKAVETETLDLSFSNVNITETYKEIIAQETQELYVYPYLNGELADDDELLFYSSSDEEVATVTNQGKIVPKKTGITFLSICT